MRRREPREDLPQLRSFRDPPGPTPTLADMQRRTPGGWLWVYCEAAGCHHRAAMAIAPLVIRWGPHADVDRLRRSARCSRCGGRGAMLQHPSWGDSQRGFEAFPTRRGK